MDKTNKFLLISITVFNYILALLFICLVVFYGLLIICAAFYATKPQEAFALAISMAIIIFGIFWLFALMLVFSCRNLILCKRYYYCLFVGCLSAVTCIGTIPGLMTLFFLFNNKTKAQFGIAIRSFSLQKINN